MSANKTNLSLSSFLLNAGNLKEQLQEITFSADNKTVDSKGIAARYAHHQVVQQDQKASLTANWYNADTTQEAVSLDISVWEPFGGDLLGMLESGSFKVMTAGVEQSGAAMAYTDTQPNGTDVEITSSHMVSTNAALIALAMTGTIDQFSANATISFAGETIEVPVVLSAGSHKIVRGQLQMEDVTVKLQGTPILPNADGTLLYLALAGSATTSLSTDTGANTYATADGSVMTIMLYQLDFKKAQLITERIELAGQGALSVS